MVTISSKLLDKYRYVHVDHIDWWACVYDDWVEALNRLGYEVEKKDLNFSGFSSQGDGASFACRINWPKWLHNHPEWRLGYVDLCTKVYSAKLQRSRSHYCHEHTVDIEIEFTDGAHQIFDYHDLDAFASHVLEAAREQMRVLYKDLEKEHDYLTSDEQVEAYIRDNILDEEEDD